MDALFEERAIENRIVEPGEETSGFVYVNIDEGTTSGSGSRPCASTGGRSGWAR